MFHVGSYVVHRKLIELGSGEIMKMEMGGITIRFASGTRNFSEVHVTQHLEKTTEAPVPPPAATPRKRAPSKKKSAAASSGT